MGGVLYDKKKNEKKINFIDLEKKIGIIKLK